MRWLLTLFFVAILFAGAFAATFTGQVVKVSDGDTIKVMHAGRAETIRLAGIDCPERGQPYSRKATQYTRDLAAGQTVTVDSETVDRYGRTIGEVILPDGRSLNRELLAAGLAWWYRKYSTDASLGILESEARQHRRGLWAGNNPQPPWQQRQPQHGD
jgi:endonuclease YncB( thermonuclease family)